MKKSNAISTCTSHLKVLFLTKKNEQNKNQMAQMAKKISIYYRIGSWFVFLCNFSPSLIVNEKNVLLSPRTTIGAKQGAS